MSKTGIATGPTTGLPAAFIPRVSNDANGYTDRETYRTRVAATIRIIPTVATAGHPIVEAWNTTLGEKVSTQT